MLRQTATGLLLGLALAACPVRAQETPAPRPGGRPVRPRSVSLAPPASPRAFGGQIQQTLIPVTGFVAEDGGYSYTTNVGKDLTPVSPPVQSWQAPLGLPSGAAIEEIRVFVRDEDAEDDIEAGIVFVARAADGSDACDEVFGLTNWTSESAGLDGLGVLTLQDDEPLLIRTQDLFPPAFCTSDNYLWYSIRVSLLSVDHSFSGVVVRWRRAVSPAPESATFNDVPTQHPFFQFVEALAASGITAGCGSGNYCPDSALTRGQMAVFLAKALGLHWPL